MSRIRKVVLSAALLVLSALSASVPAAAHEGDPHYRSVVDAIRPATDGLSATVLDHDDALSIVNKSDEDVTILDHQGKPYARLLADGTVQVNAHSALATGENAPAVPHGQDAHDSADARLYASVTLLAHGDDEQEADGSSHAGEAGVDWVTIDRTGRYEWHDDRIKYRAQPVPPQVTDSSKETKVFDWRVPLLIGGQAGAILGTLTWIGEPGGGSSFPTAAVISLVVLALLAAAAVVLVRRRRRTAEAGTP